MNEEINIFSHYYNSPKEKAIVIISHGLLEHSGRYNDLIQYFLPLGYSFQVYDLRGHGQSGGKRGHIEVFDQYAEDLNQIVEQVSEKHPSVDLFLVGHSMGALINLFYAVNYKPPTSVKGLIFSGTSFTSAPLTPSQKIKTFIGKRIEPYFPLLMVDPEITVETLSNDPKIIVEHSKDSKILPKISVRLALQLFKASKQSDSMLNNYNFPSLLLHGDHDVLVSRIENEYVFKNLNNGKKQVIKSFEGVRHEVFNAKPNSRIQVYNEMYLFMESLTLKK